LFGTEIFGFCFLTLSFFYGIALAPELKYGEIRVQNVEIAGKRKCLNEFNNSNSIIMNGNIIFLLLAVIVIVIWIFNRWRGNRMHGK